MKTIRVMAVVSAFVLLLLSWREIGNVSSGSKGNVVSGATSFQNRKYVANVFALTNDNLLKLVLSGQGGYVYADTSGAGLADTNVVLFPAYLPPKNVKGVLKFPSSDDYFKFIEAANLMERLWIYPEKDFEDTPFEIYHLGEESLNAFDSAIDFQSLRHKYELNEFYNYDWRDTAKIYVEDDDIRIVLNENNEFEIGDKYYKYLGNSIVAEINDSEPVLDSVRALGVFVNSPDVSIYNEQTDSITSPVWGKPQGIQGCTDFRIGLSAGLSSYVNPTSSKWSINTEVLSPVSGTHPNRYRNVKGSYTIDWGDGTIDNFTGYFTDINYYYHIYQYPSAGYLNRSITVTCKLVKQPNPTPEYLELLANCDQLRDIIFTATKTISLESYNYPDCLKGRILREFIGVDKFVNGVHYRTECKLKQVTRAGGFIIRFQRPKIEAVVTFWKVKNGHWRGAKSPKKLWITMRGNVYKPFSCSDLFYTINYSVAENRSRKVKMSIEGIIGSIGGYFPNDIGTSRLFPDAINADFLWNYNNGPTVFGNYSEPLKP